jgi:hypothetical protein
MPKLISIRIDESLPHLGTLGLINLAAAEPLTKLHGWSVAVRGPAVFLVSPPGWDGATPYYQLKPTGPVRVMEVPRAKCVLQWEIDPPPHANGREGKDEAARIEKERAADLAARPALDGLLKHTTPVITPPRREDPEGAA